LLDLMLPKITGIEILQQIRASPVFKDLPVVVFSNTFLNAMIEEAWKAGATKCLAKATSTPRQVIEVVNELLASAARPAVPASAAPVRKSSDADSTFQAELRRAFIAGLPASLAVIKQIQQSIVQTEERAMRLPLIADLYRKTHSLTSNAGVAGVAMLARMASALEALLKELHEKPEQISPSTVRTITQTVALLGVMAERVEELPPNSQFSAHIMAVDDDAISLRAVLHSLEKAELKGQGLQSPVEALRQLSESAFDLVILDVDMPEMNGFELCKKLRALPAYEHTPVIYVTSHSDFQSRAKSLLTGANDLIAKPFLFIELAVKALAFVLKRQLPKPPAGA
ncbi:MAG: response regulator, partial [Verrucomicrobia bacterium]|nr:response regulator [Verrucomicrobiota bacterium]